MDKIELQRLLDGELDHSQRQSALCQLDEQPTEWRTVALALLEEQDFRRELGPQSSFLGMGTVDERRLSLRESTHLLEAKSDNRNVEIDNRKVKNSQNSLKHWTSIALAASLLLGVGFLGGNWLASTMEQGEQTTSMSQGPSIASVDPPNRNRPEWDYASLKPVGKLSFTSDAPSNANVDPVQLPMYEAAPEQISQMLQNQQQQMHAWNEQLRRRGYELDWQPEMLESRLPDGRAVIVPVQQVKVRSFGQ